jgi:transposase
VKPWNSREELVHQVVTLAKVGTARRAIARALGISRNTVKAILKDHTHERVAEQSALPCKPPRAPRAMKLEPFAGVIVELLTRYPDITAQRVFEELRDKGYTGGYTAVKDHVRAVRPPNKPQPSLTTPTYGPGEMAECDWSPYRVRLLTGKEITVQAFGYTLCFSRRKVYGLYERADLYSLMDGHVMAFARLGGAAASCKYDNQKPVVLRWEGQQPVYNPRFLAFATHYEFRVHACRPRRPNDKPKVERGFWHFERSFLNGRSFRDLEDMRAQLARWQDTILDHHPHKTLKRSALEVFAEEAPLLLPLPAHPYDTARVVYRICSVDGFIAWDGNRYAVPYDSIYDILPVRVTARELFVYAPDLHLLARHELAPRSAGLDLDPAQLHRAGSRPSVDLDALRATFEALGDGAADFFAGLLRLGPRLSSFHARQILLLRERFDSDAIAAALRHAHCYGAYEQLAVSRILQARSTPRTLDEYVAEETSRRLEQRWGCPKTQPRDLNEYDRLPVLSAPVSTQKETSCHDAPNPPTPDQRPTLPTPSSPSSGSDDSSMCSA